MVSCTVFTTERWALCPLHRVPWRVECRFVCGRVLVFRIRKIGFGSLLPRLSSISIALSHLALAASIMSFSFLAEAMSRICALVSEIVFLASKPNVGSEGTFRTSASKNVVSSSFLGALSLRLHQTKCAVRRMFVEALCLGRR